MTKTVTAMRGICNERLKIDVEYGLKRGTTDNSYLIKVCTTLIHITDITLYRSCTCVSLSRCLQYQDFGLLILGRRSALAA